MIHRRRRWRSPFPKRRRKSENLHRMVTCQIGPCCRLLSNVAMIYAKSCLPINCYVYFVIAGLKNRRRSGSDRTRSSSPVRIRAWSSQSLTRLVFIKSRKWCRAGWNSTLSVNSAGRPLSRALRRWWILSVVVPVIHLFAICSKSR